MKVNEEELKNRINGLPDKFFEYDKSGRGYVCPVCGSGSGKHGTGLSVKRMVDGRMILTCWKCGESGDVIHWLMKTKHMSYLDVLEYGMRELNVGDENVASRYVSIDKEEKLIDYSKLYEEAELNLEQTDYWRKRGLSLETCRKFHLGYIKNWRHPKVLEYVKTTPRLIIPISEHGYLARDIQEKVLNEEKQYIKSKVGKMSLFNIEALSNEVVYIVEGEIDAMSLYEVGINAVGLGSLAYKEMLIKELKKMEMKPKLVILALDNDEAGKKASESVSKALESMEISFMKINLYGDKKDANEALMANRDELQKVVENVREKTLKLIASRDESEKVVTRKIETRQKYLMQKEFLKDISLFNKYAEYKTGYRNIDKYGSLYPGLYVLGAVPSLGKTTFMNQMSSQLTEQGHYVLFISYEQSRFELISKGLSRLTYGTKKQKTAMEIRSGADVTEAMERYVINGDKEYIYEAEFEDTIEEICEQIDKLMKEGIKPMVIIDYLQVIAPSANNKGHQLGTKDNIDNIVKRIKSMQRENKLIVFLISSLNRQNYLTQIDFESFKESGGIEYTADVVWGMQLACMQEAIFEKAANLNEKRERVREAKAETPRKIELICLKNRYGRAGYRCLFNYYPAYDYFEPCIQDEIKSKLRQIKIDESLIV